MTGREKPPAGSDRTGRGDRRRWKSQLAMPVIDLVALGPDDESAVLRTRSIKTDLGRARSKQIAPYPSKGLSVSSGLRLKQGIISWEGVIK